MYITFHWIRKVVWVHALKNSAVTLALSILGAIEKHREGIEVLERKVKRQKEQIGVRGKRGFFFGKGSKKEKSNEELTQNYRGQEANMQGLWVAG